jgi:hypothetical protein
MKTVHESKALKHYRFWLHLWYLQTLGVRHVLTKFKFITAQLVSGVFEGSLKPNEKFFGYQYMYIMARTSYIQYRWCGW